MADAGVVRLDLSYLKKRDGIMKGIAIVLNLISSLCIWVSGNSMHSRASWFLFVSSTGLIVSLLLLIFYIFHIVEKLSALPWTLFELGFCALFSFFNMTSSAACAAPIGGNPALEAWVAGAFFGFIVMVVYGVDAFFKFKKWRLGEPAQGEASASSSTVPKQQTPVF